MKFEDYHISGEIKKSISKLGYKRPTDIQFKTIPHVLKGEDVLAIAQTGTGKTAAFAIPIIERLHLINKTKRSKAAIRALVMVPTRELALQIGEVFSALCVNTRVSSFALIGGVEQDAQIERLDGKVDILISTPGRLFDLVSQGHLRLDKISILVLDEADHMLDLGFIKDIRDLMWHLPRRRQTLFFSATIDKEIKKLAYSLVNKPIRIQISPKDPVAKNVEHAVLFVEMDDKRFFLEHLIKQWPKSKFLVFTRTKVRAERVLKAMERLEISALSMHGDKSQQARGVAMKAFAQGESNVLIATDVSARGIDIPHVDYVINYDLPEQAETYVHRVGRTGRGTHKGQAFSFCSPHEKELLQAVEELIGHKVSVVNINKNDYETVLDMSEDSHADWKSLLQEVEDAEEAYKKRKRKKKK